MINSPSLISKLFFGCTALVIANAPCAKAMTKAYDCFDRNTGELSAQSIIDISSVSLQCVSNQDIEEFLAQSSSPKSENSEVDFNNNEDDSQYKDESNEYDYDELSEYDDDELGEYDDTSAEDYESDESTGQQLGVAAGNHLGKLFGNLLNDIMGK